MLTHVTPDQIRRDDGRPAAITGVGDGGTRSGDRSGELQLGVATCSARTRNGFWGLYQNGDEVVVVHPGGAMIGPPVGVAAELDRLDAARSNTFDRAAADAILAFLTGPDTLDQGVAATRTWSSPATGYWLSGPANQPDHAHQPPGWPGAPARPPTPQALPGLLPTQSVRPDPSQPAPPRAA
jgi:hypothetical protein